MTVATFEAGAERRSQGWAVLVRIEGLGNFAGQYTFCSARPTYAASDSNYLRTVQGWPAPTSERGERQGGMPELSGLDVDLVDRGLTISRALSPDRSPVTVLDGAIDANDTTIVLLSSGGLAASDGVIWIGTEAITYTTRSGSTLTGVTRAALGTRARSHSDAASVYASSPFLGGRTMSVALVPIDASTSAAELPIGEFALNTAKMNRQLASWRLGGYARSKILGRRLAQERPPVLRLVALVNGGNLLRVAVDPEGLISIESLRTWSAADQTIWLRAEDGGEIIRCTKVSAIELQVDERGAVGTEIKELRPGARFREVLVSDPHELAYSPGWNVKFSPGPSPTEDRGSGLLWNDTAHWVDILLAVLTSSAGADDALELVNHRGSDTGLTDEGRSNWSALPVGMGLGVPAALIDFDSFVRVRARTPGMRFPAVVIGHDQPTFGDFARQLLEVAGASLVTIGGRITLSMPRMPLSGETLAALDTSNVVEVEEPIYDLTPPTGVRYTVGPSTFTLRAKDIGFAIDDSGAERLITIDAPSLDSYDAALGAIILYAAASLISVVCHRGWRVRLTADSTAWATVPGDYVHLSHGQITDLETGERGIADIACRVSERQGPGLSKERGLSVGFELIAHPATHTAARVAPAAVVASSALSGTDRVVTVDADRFCAGNADVLELPTSDEDAFAVGDYVIEETRAGVQVGSAREVLDIGAGTITIEGSAAPTAGNRLVTADYDDQSADQRAAYASMGTILLPISRYAGR